MKRFLVRRLLLTIPVLLGVATLVFSLIHLVPGDPVQAMLGESASPEDIAEMRERLGLDRPLFVQYVVVPEGRRRPAISGRRCARTSRSPRRSPSGCRRPSSSRSRRCSWRSLIAIPLGIIAAVRAGTRVDHAATTLALLGISMPNFWLGPLLAIVFSVSLGWLPVSGRGTLAHLVLPAITLGAPLAAVLARMTRASVIEELRELYVLAARARGVSRARAVLRHAFRNSLIPIVTVLGLQFGAVLTGAVITETIFAWPGVGRLLIQSISFRDYPLVQGCILLIAVTYVVDESPDGSWSTASSIRGSAMSERVLKTGARASSCLAALGGRCSARSLTPFDPSAQELPLRLAGPSGDASLRPRRARTRHPRAGARRRAHLVPRRPDGRVGVGRRSARCSARSPAISAAWLDDVISRVIDTLLAFPGLLLAIALVAVLGPSLANVLFALTIIGWVGYARLVRGQVLRAREFEYVQAARALGRGDAAHPLAARRSRPRSRRSSFRRRSAWPARSSARRR